MRAYEAVYGTAQKSVNQQPIYPVCSYSIPWRVRRQLPDYAHPTGTEFHYFPSGDGLDRGAFCRRSGAPSRVCRRGKRKLTESAKEFPKDSLRQIPKGSLREAPTRSDLIHPRASLPSSRLLWHHAPLWRQGWYICLNMSAPYIFILDHTEGIQSLCI